jgi:alpha-L-fucosidase
LIAQQQNTTNPMKHIIHLVFSMLLALPFAHAADPSIRMTPLPDAVRGKEIADMKWGMFVCWSFSTFSGVEWTRDPHGPDFFKPTGCDTDQWCQAAREAGMGYILFLTKHHDGFCLWDTQTTDLKVTNSPLKKDVLAELRKSCDRYGLKLALYFSEGDWSMDRKKATAAEQAEFKKSQLKELLTQYGPIEFIWFDHAAGTGGLSHADTDKWVRGLQPNCFSGFNSGEAAGRLSLRERGKPGPIGGGGLNWVEGQDEHEKSHPFSVAEFTYPLLGKHSGASGDGADWFYSKPKYDGMALPAGKIYQDYLDAVKHGNIFSLNVGPDYAGKLRDIDVRTLRAVGRMIRGEIKIPLPIPGKATASGTWPQAGYDAAKATDGDPSTRWGAEVGSSSGWLAIEFGGDRMVRAALVNEAGFARIRKYEIQARMNGEWKTVATGTAMDPDKEIVFPAPVRAKAFRLNILDSADVPTIGEFQLFE